MPRKPSLTIHGGAGSISHSSLPPSSPLYTAYTTSIREVLESTYPLLLAGHSALTAATHAATLLENNPLFNAGKGSVFTRDGRNELEASVMVSRGYRKRGVGVAMLTRVKNPILLARELLVRGEGGVGADAGQGHNFLSGAEAERLAEEWGCEMVDPGYFWTERRWEEHLRGLKKENGYSASGGVPDEDLQMEKGEYLSQGTVGCVAMDIHGTLCVATSTGGLTNKLPGRIGDTPTLAAGFWAEEWRVNTIPALPDVDHHKQPRTRAVALSGTGNGDYFLRLAVAHNISSRCRFGGLSLKEAAEAVVGRGGEMQRAAGERWGLGDGSGGIIGLDEKGDVVMVMNCGGMFRGYIDKEGKARVGVYWDEKEI
ncbi:N-terminal nucleophile aminohydrolase [Choiromyces venosus 120613-1]|uniref:N-terminal nucleophile aminohydrolase n=1 Tax=Choiromyces venosus 120613-1 TaxID=1336337 RepID=A0A3N4IZ59_9PEZI|nr:N-terminal nucleophile aminohydrolase [Choiromyces venosus 120613-1]